MMDVDDKCGIADGAQMELSGRDGDVDDDDIIRSKAVADGGDTQSQDVVVSRMR